MPIRQDSIAVSDLKYANLIFVEHKKLLTENSLLTTQVNNLNALNSQLEQADSLRTLQLNEYKEINTVYSYNIEELKSEVTKKSKLAKGWKIGCFTVSAGLILFLILK